MGQASPLALQRLHQQGISAPIPGQIAQTVRHLLAVQAQDYHGALWAIGLRSAGAVEADVEQAIAERRIVRTWPMRGTLHFIAAEDARWMLALMAARTLARDGKRQEREFGLDAKSVASYAELVRRLLEGGRGMTRAALYEALQRKGIATDGQRGLHILGRLAHEGVLCQGPRESRQPTFVLLDDWLPAAPALDREAALAELARRYYAGHGPATVQDLAWWSGLTVRDAQAATASVAGSLSWRDHDGQRHWFGEREDAEAAKPSIHLLPPFDEYLVGYRDRSAALEPAHVRRVVGINGLFSPSIAIDGRIAATWKRHLRKDGASLVLTALRPLRAADLTGIRRAAARYGRFIGQAVTVSEQA